MDYIDVPAYPKVKPKSNPLADEIRSNIMEYSKDFKTSWVSLGQALFNVWRDKMYEAWGFDKFEHYTEKEVGLPKPIAIKLLKTYYFLEQEEPAYLQKEFSVTRDALKVPSYEAINVLRMARGKKELLREDYSQLKKSVFDKGKDAGLVRKELTTLMKERKQVDPDEERQSRSEAAIQKVLASLKLFKRDSEVLKLLPPDILSETKNLIQKLEAQIQTDS